MELTVQDLMKLVAPYALHKWKLVGTSLGLQSGHLEAIDQQYRGDPSLCYLSLFSRWKDGLELPFTWNAILDILMSPLVHETQLANFIIEKLTR